MHLKEITTDKFVNSIFTEKPFGQLSEKYVHIPTNVILDDMQKLGWKVCDTQQVKSKKKAGYQKHIIKFFNPDITIKGDNGDDAFPQILLINSHDGTSSFQFRVGLYRLVCSNGLVIATKEFGNISLRHVGYTFDELRKTVNGLVEQLPTVVEKINRFTEKEMTENQILAFAKKAVEVRFGENYNVDLEMLTKADRKEDEGSSLWKVFNRVQEKLVNGGFHATSTFNQKRRKIRSIKSFVKDVKMNEQLWELAEQFVA